MRFLLGSHLIVERSAISGPSHAVYLGTGRVVHWDEKPPGPSLVETAIEAFAGGQPVTVRKHLCPLYRGLGVVRRVRSLLAHPADVPPFEDGERFCEWSINGARRHSLAQTFIDLAQPAAGEPGPPSCAPEAAAASVKRRPTPAATSGLGVLPPSKGLLG